MSGFLRLFALVSLYIHLTYGAIYDDAAALSKKSYDYIVVGGGLAGSVIAGRLAENPSSKILVIEAGISNAGVQVSEVPYFCALTFPRTSLTWNYTTTEQLGLKNRVIEYSRGRMLGGSTGINVMISTRGSSEEYDRLATASGDQSWSYKNIMPYILKHEKWVSPRDGHDTTGQYDPAYHSTSGKLQITLPNYPTAIDDKVMQTLGGEFKFVQDMNSGKPLGFGWVQSYTGGGSRSSAATAYLTGQSNIDILLQKTATRVIQSGKKNGLPYFNTVEIAASSSSPRFLFTAGKEVILAAGAVNTPQLLLLSGIGPKADLDKYGIKTIVNSKDVGKNMQDHPLMTHQFEVTGNDNTFQSIMGNVSTYLPLWQNSKQGPLTNTLNNHIGWTRLDSSDPAFTVDKDPAAGPNSPHIEYLPFNGFASFTGQTPAPDTNYVSVFTVVAAPSSRGSITLQSTNPFDAPLIDPAFLATPLDLHVAVEAARAVRRFVAAAPWQGYVIKPHHDAAKYDFTKDSDVEDYVKSIAGTEWHPSCTAAMSSASSPDGVVDNKLCVKGASGLRIVDASVFTAVPAAHPSALLFAIAEKAADMIKAKSC